MRVYLWILSYLRVHMKSFVLLVATILAITLAELAVPKLVQYFVDHAYAAKDKKFLYILGSLFAVSILVLFIAKAGENRFQRILQERASRDLQLDIFKQLRRLGFPYLEKHTVGETLSFLNTEVRALQEIYRLGLPHLFNGLIFAVLAVSIMISTNLKLTLAVLIPVLLLYYVFGPKIENIAAKYAKEATDYRLKENEKIYESITSLTEVRAYGSEKWDFSRFQSAVDAYTHKLTKSVFYAFLRGTNRRMTYYIGGLILFVYGNHLVVNQQITVGGFISFLLYYFSAVHKLTLVITNVTEQRMQVYQAERLYRFMQETPNIKEPVDGVVLENPEGELEFDRVGFAYDDRVVLDSFSLVIKAGTKVAIVGESGCGKTTLLKLAARFYDPSSGVIRLDGVPLDQLSLESLRGTFGIVFQDTFLFGMSVKENIRFGNPEATDEDVIQAAKAAYAHEFIMSLPEGYDSEVGERGVKLSGGQKQRIAIARLFIKQPRLLLLDEATSALDQISEWEVQRAMEQLLDGRTMIAVAHRISTIKNFDQIIMMEKGKIVEAGTYQTLLEQRGAFYRLVHKKPMEVEVHA
ncbi:ABC transporter ATP-binding protein [Paenibacillus sp. NPDC058071]|uniref:ABC transporter ATP-binding protein n=1 Tax=Paenibacillus sp. NPDC058071 TaxID=3346326 RepID=UPI0036DD6915